MVLSPNIVAIHGIHDDGDDGIDQLAREVAAELKLPIFLPKLARSSAVGDYISDNVAGDAGIVAPHINSKSLILTHSRGAYVADQALKHYGSKWAHLIVMFAPALPADVIPCGGRFNNLLVVHNRHDRALKWSRFLPWHPYANFFGGSLGRDGWTGPVSDKIRNIPAHDDRSFLDHSEYWRDADARASWVDFVCKRYRAAEGFKP